MSSASLNRGTLCVLRVFFTFSRSEGVSRNFRLGEFCEKYARAYFKGGHDV